MKAKPNTDQFKSPKDPSAFLEGGAADAADSVKTVKPHPTEPITQSKIHREQKVFRLPLQLINALKREAYERSISSGSRVTETEIVEQALENLLKR
jgi:chromatin segregation and condensation protein Rec8/ScpA/Scc1 (kleisin family)